MIILTESLKQFLFRKYPKELPLIVLGHVELFTKDMEQEYLDWCRTEEGRSYLQGGANYKEPN